MSCRASSNTVHGRSERLANGSIPFTRRRRNLLEFLRIHARRWRENVLRGDDSCFKMNATCKSDTLFFLQRISKFSSRKVLHQDHDSSLLAFRRV
jgi:hypothetical protein